MIVSKIKFFGLLFSFVVCLVFGAPVVYATHDGGTSNGGSQGEHTNSGSTAVSTGPNLSSINSVYACTLTAVPRVVAVGTTPTVSITRAPVYGVGTLTRKPVGGVAQAVASYAGTQASVDDTSVGSLSLGVYTYSAGYGVTTSRRVQICEGNNRDCPSGTHRTVTDSVTYTCSTDLRVVTAITECNDQVDNSDTEDVLSDAQDPGCHTDGDSTNASSYDDTLSESNAPANLVASVKRTGSLISGMRVYINGSIKNDAPINVGTLSDRIIGWRKIGTACVRIGRANRNETPCVSLNGTQYYSIYNGAGVYAPNQRWSADTSFVPTTSGSYEVCVLADTQNSVVESNEGDNISCTTFTVADPTTATPLSVDVSVRTQQPQGPWVRALSVLAGQQINLQWEPSPSAVSCVSLSPSLFSLPGANTNSRGTVTNVVEPTAGAQAYTVECADSGGNKARSSATAIVGGVITGPLTLLAQPSHVRKGTPTTVEWNTGGRTACSITGTNGESFAVSSLTGSHTTTDILATAIYTISCVDDGSEVSTTVHLIPQFQEI